MRLAVVIKITVEGFKMGVTLERGRILDRDRERSSYATMFVIYKRTETHTKKGLVFIDRNLTNTSICWIV